MVNKTVSIVIVPFTYLGVNMSVPGYHVQIECDGGRFGAVDYIEIMTKKSKCAAASLWRQHKSVIVVTLPLADCVVKCLVLRGRVLIKSTCEQALTTCDSMHLTSDNHRIL